MNIPTTLDELCEAAALRFLRSAVVIDDRPVRPLPAATELVTPNIVTVLARKPQPDVLAQDLDQADLGESTVNGPTGGAIPESKVSLTQNGAKEEERDLEEADLVEAFAEQGIACAVLTPPIVDQPRVKAATRADVLVVDWRLGASDNGEQALDLITKIRDAKQPAGRRLLCIYTSATLDDVVLRVAKLLDIDADGTERSIDTGGLRVVVFPKSHHSGEGVSESELPSILVKEFVVTFRGLISAVAINALAAVRDNLPRVLHRLGSDLDEGYLGHTLMLPYPADAVDHVRTLISDELRTVIDDDALTADAAGAQGMLSWLRDREVALMTDLTSLEKHLTGIEIVNVAGIGKKDRTKLIVGNDPAKAERANVEFASMMAFRIHYPGGRPHSLEPGVILRDEKGNHFVCVQPLCDSVRLDTPTAQFPFLPCPTITNGQFTFCLVDGDNRVKLGLDNKFDKVAQISFDVDPELRTIRLSESMTEVIGKQSKGNARTFTPIGLLRPDHAKRLSQNVGKEVSRIGLDESEWSRLSSPKPRN